MFQAVFLTIAAYLANIPHGSLVRWRFAPSAKTRGAEGADMNRSLLWSLVFGVSVVACGDDASGSGGGGGGSSSGDDATAASTGGTPTSSSTGSSPQGTGGSGDGGDATTSAGGHGGESGTGGGGEGGGGTGIETSHGGLELDEWMKAYWEWALGADQEGFIQDRTFLELPAGTDDDGDGVYTGQIDIALSVEDGWAVPIQAWIGETYENGDPPDDDPDGFPLEDVFTSMDIVITLDGEVIIDSAVDDLSLFYWDSIFFDETIPYDAPTDYGAVGAVWTKGLGYLHTPLPPGEHVLHLVSYVEDFAVGYDNTWNITVE